MGFWFSSSVSRILLLRHHEKENKRLSLIRSKNQLNEKIRRIIQNMNKCKRWIYHCEITKKRDSKGAEMDETSNKIDELCKIWESEDIQLGILNEKLKEINNSLNELSQCKLHE